MTLMDHFRRQLEYDTWANREVLRSLRALADPPESCLRLLAHVIAAERLWLARIQAATPPMPVWPDLPFDACETQLAELHRAFTDYFDRELPAALDHEIRYKNSKGEPWASRVDDILTHVFFHSAYHRGQIATHMRQAGFAPAYTDFIHGIRQGLVK